MKKKMGILTVVSTTILLFQPRDSIILEKCNYIVIKKTLLNFKPLKILTLLNKINYRHSVDKN